MRQLVLPFSISTIMVWLRICYVVLGPTGGGGESGGYAPNTSCKEMPEKVRRFKTFLVINSSDKYEKKYHFSLLSPNHPPPPENIIYICK